VGVQATDSLNNVTSKVLKISAALAKAYSLVDGQLEVLVTVPVQMAGVNNFTLSVTDSKPTTITQTFSYQADEPISGIYIDEFAFDHYWGTGDTATVVLPILGDLSGYTINSQTTPLSNGLMLDVDGINNVVSVTGPPTTFSNSQVYVQLPILQGSNQVATITREYTLLAHNGTTDIGPFQCYTRPYIVGDFVGLNPLKPWFNSPTISKASGSYARVQAGSSLPPGLSLDANTALIYGTLAGISTGPSTVEYYDSLGVVHATITITWDTQLGSFTLQDNLTDGEVQQAYTGTIGSTSSVKLTAASVYRGRLPFGLSIAPDVSGTFVSITGTPTEAGYFDLWFRVVNQNGQSGYLYRRFIITYINPLVILTSSLPTASTGQPYNGSGFVLQGYGGTPPYTWSLDGTPPALPTGMSLAPLTGLLSGTPTNATYSQNLVIDLEDSASVKTSAVLLLAINNSIVITTTTLPNIIPGQNYSFSMSATGGVRPYTWAIQVGTLPTGITFNTSTGAFSGLISPSAVPYSQSITIRVTDSASTSTSKTFTLATGSSAMLIDTSGVGLVDRGAPYQGRLRAYGTFTTPNTWQVAPDSPNPLPAGLTLQANSADNGTTAFISGSTTVLMTNYSVKITAVDSLGASAQAFVLLNTTSSLAITTTSLPAGVVTGSYSFQMTATGVNTPFTWSPSTVGPYSMSSSGLITGTTGSTYNSNITFQVTDNLGDTYPLAPLAQATLNLTVQTNTLQITTASLPNATAGRSYTTSLAAAGGAAPYTWSISPASAKQLPSGLSLNSSTGAITGTTTVIGSSGITFRVTDSNNAYNDKLLTLAVISGITLFTGPDYTDSTSTNYLGYVDQGSTSSITPRPNYSFYVVATGVVTTNSSTLLAGITITNSGYTASIDSLSGGVAYIRITGPFALGIVGDNSFGITVVDSGVSVTGTFKWKVFSDGILRAVATNAFPQQLAEG